MGGVAFHCLEFWLAGGVLVGFSNDIYMEVLMCSIDIPFGSSVGVSLGRRGSGWWSVVLFVPLQLRWFLDVFACGGFFPPLSSDLWNILINSLHRALARH